MSVSNKKKSDPEAANDLLERLRSDPHFSGVDFDDILQQGHYVGRAPHQVSEFIDQEIEPVRQRYSHLLNQSATVYL
jgi:adenylosuccinate lyase